MNNIERIKILKRIEFIKTEIEDIKRYKDINYDKYMENRDLQRIIERIIENIVNAIIDISKIILVYSDIPIPDTYRDIILSLKELNMVNSEVIENISNLTRLRNILAHQYLDIKWELIENFLKKEVNFVESFVTELEKKI